MSRACNSLHAGMLPDPIILHVFRKVGPPAPLWIVPSGLHISVEAGVRPILWPLDQTVFDRICVNVIHVHVEVPRVSNSVLPEPLLPHATPSMPPLIDRDGAFPSAPCQVRSRESFLQYSDASGIVGVSFWQPPQHVQMIRQQHDGLHFPRALSLRAFDRVTE